MDWKTPTQEHDSYLLEVHQRDHIAKIEPIAEGRERRLTPEAEVSKEEVTKLRGLNGELSWIARQMMPEIAYETSDSQQRVSEATVRTVLDANATLRKAKDLASAGHCLMFKAPREPDPEPTPVGDVACGTVVDVSFMGQPREGSQQGFITLVAERAVLEGEGLCHMVEWGSEKVHRKVRSTLAAEAGGASHGWDRDRGCYARAVLAEMQKGYKKSWVDMTDCRSKFDLLQGSMPQERRVALDLLDVRECIEQWGDTVRWIPTGVMLADALTKRMPPDVLRQVMTDNRYSFRWSEAADTARERGREARQRRKKEEEKEQEKKSKKVNEILQTTSRALRRKLTQQLQEAVQALKWSPTRRPYVAAPGARQYSKT